MARIRTIKPEFFTSEDIVSLSPLARLLYIAVWCEADKEGRLVWRPRTFKLRYLPADSCDVEALCGELVAAGLVVLYGDGLAYIPKFSRHQHINPRESASTLPDPDEKARVTDASARVSDAQVGREGKGKEGKDSSEANASGGKPPADEGQDETPEDPRRELYQAGKSLLHEQGMPKAQTGSFITKLAQDYGQDVALEAVRSAVSNRPLEAAAYLKATCQRLKGERKDPITVPSTDTGAEKFKAAMDERAATATKPPAAVLELARKAVRTA